MNVGPDWQARLALPGVEEVGDGEDGQAWHLDPSFRSGRRCPDRHSRELVTASGLPASALIVVGNDHRLADPEPLAALLAAVERTS